MASNKINYKEKKLSENSKQYRKRNHYAVENIFAIKSNCRRWMLAPMHAHASKINSFM